jgi:hypothetical protein
MAKTASSKELKESKTPKVAKKKLDFLLDTIDTEVANLVDVVNVQGPILEDKTSRADGGAISHSNGSVELNSLELDMDFSTESEYPPAEEKSVVNGAQAALDAMSDAEGEVEAILSMEDPSGHPAVAAEAEIDKNKVDSDLSKALDELLATREGDVSKLVQKKEEPKVGQNKEPEPQKVQTDEDQLPEDLFDDLDKDLELVLEGAAAENQTATGSELEEDLFGDLEMDLAAEKTEGAATKEAAIEAGISRDLFETTEQNIAVEEKEESEAEAVTATSNSDEELADLLNKKIEGLVNRLVEERLSEIAERVIMKKINKIFKSMK